MINHYEATILLFPHLSENAVEDFVNSLLNFVQEEEGIFEDSKNLGIKPLGYEIKNQVEAILIVVRFTLSKEKIEKVYRFLKEKEDTVLRFIIEKKKVKKELVPQVGEVKEKEEKEEGVALEEVESALEELFERKQIE